MFWPVTSIAAFARNALRYNGQAVAKSSLPLPSSLSSLQDVWQPCQHKKTGNGFYPLALFFCICLLSAQLQHPLQKASPRLCSH
ncbi:hypothetical protein DWUX_810 [Desulfovibrio diazotrophicus]|nr:hypothetical protein DWUX_810 [Desulfovibrio diazotrophicus]